MRARRGFTLVETALAATLGSLVLLGTVGVFMVAARTERTFSSRFTQTNQMAGLQLTLRRAMLTLVMKENTVATQNGDEEESDADRPRIILAPDEIVAAILENGPVQPGGAASVQRLEVVLSAPPLPNSLLGPAAGWASPSSIDGLDFSLADLEGENTGGVRGVFELRPDGQRERLMRSVGLDRPDWVVPEPNAKDTGWTLWWRPMSPEEIQHLSAGGAWLWDDVLSEAGQLRLAGAAPLLTGLTECRWQFFENREMLEAYVGLEMNDLPAYVTLELRTATGLYANWMLEMGWTVGADPNADDEEDDDAASGADDGEAQTQTQAGTGGGARRGQAERGRGRAGGSRRGSRTNEPAPPPDDAGRSFSNTRTLGGDGP